MMHYGVQKKSDKDLLLGVQNKTIKGSERIGYFWCGMEIKRQLTFNLFVKHGVGKSFGCFSVALLYFYRATMNECQC